MLYCALMNTDRMLTFVGLICTLLGIAIGALASIYASDIKGWISKRRRAGKASTISQYISTLKDLRSKYETVKTNNYFLTLRVAEQVLAHLRAALSVIGFLILISLLIPVTFDIIYRHIEGQSITMADLMLTGESRPPMVIFTIELVNFLNLAASVL